MIFNLSGATFETPVLNSSYPANKSVTYVSGESKSATFEVKISTAGSPDEYTYQWYVNDSAVSGATSSSYTKTGLTAGTYSIYCKVTNAAGSVNSRTAILTVTLYKTPVLNTSYPANASVTYVSGESKSAKFEVLISTAGVPASYTYQWYVDDKAVSGATSSSYTKSGLTAGTYKVYCKVTNAAGTVTSRTATLTVTLYKTPVLNTSYPANASVTYVSGESKSATFKVTIATAGVPASYTYQWYVDDKAVSGATGSSYTKTGLTAGTYKVYCKVTNAAGTVTSRTATLTVTLYKTPVLNTSYPANVTQVEKSGGSATFKVTIATAGVPASYTYQWYVDDKAVSGATSSSYTKSGLTAAATYKVYCKVTNAAGTVTSRTATLTVKSSQPSYTYSGSHTLVKEGTYNWKLTLKSSGKLKFTNLGTGDGSIQVFLVGGGGGGALAGGGGGYTKTEAVTIEAGTEYTITVGGGGTAATSGKGGTGGASSAFDKTANGGLGGYNPDSGKGGKGGSAGGSYGNQGKAGNGGSDGSDGGGSSYQYQDSDGSWKWATNTGTAGQGTTTREFGTTSGTLYSGGGGGGNANKSHNNGGYGGDGGGGNGAGRGASSSAAATAGGTNTGGGGGGGYSTSLASKNGGSGIIVIRNKR